MSSHFQDTSTASTARTMNVEIDGEVYHFHISSHHDEQFLLRASKKVNEVIEQMRREIPRLSYPMLLILVSFKLLEQMEKDDSGISFFESSLSKKNTESGTDASFLQKKISQQLVHLEKILDDARE